MPVILGRGGFLTERSSLKIHNVSVSTLHLQSRRKPKNLKRSVRPLILRSTLLLCVKCRKERKTKEINFTIMWRNLQLVLVTI